MQIITSLSANTIRFKSRFKSIKYDLNENVFKDDLKDSYTVIARKSIRRNRAGVVYDARSVHDPRP